MRSGRHWAKVLAGTGLVASMSLQPAWSQGVPRAPAASAPVAAPDAGGTRGPSFQSGGLKLTVVTASTSVNAVTLSLILENVGRNDVLVGLIGPVTGVAGGVTLNSQSVGGIAYCNFDNRPRIDQIQQCLAKESPLLPIQQFTLIEHGNTIPFNVTLAGKAEKGQVLALAMTAATVPDDDHSDVPADAPPPVRGAKPAAGIPTRMRFISLGIPAVPLAE